MYLLLLHSWDTFIQIMSKYLLPHLSQPHCSVAYWAVRVPALSSPGCGFTSPSAVLINPILLLAQPRPSSQTGRAELKSTNTRSSPPPSLSHPLLCPPGFLSLATVETVLCCTTHCLMFFLVLNCLGTFHPSILSIHEDKCYILLIYRSRAMSLRHSGFSNL